MEDQVNITSNIVNTLNNLGVTAVFFLDPSEEQFSKEMVESIIDKNQKIGMFIRSFALKNKTGLAKSFEDAKNLFEESNSFQYY